MTEEVKEVDISLESLMAPSRTVTIDYPGFDGFTVDLCYLAREDLVKIRKKCVSSKYDKKTKRMEEVLDEDKFLTEYCKSIIKGWKGFKFQYLEELLLVEHNHKPDQLWKYTEKNAELLMKNSTDFDTWVSETVGELENFTGNK